MSTSNSLESKYLLMIFAAMGLFLATSVFVQARAILLHSQTSDFSAYFSAYTIKRELGQGIYQPDAFHDLRASQTVPSDIREYLYSPLFADVLSAFMPKDYTQARLVWLVVEHASVFLLFILTGLILLQVTPADRVSAFAVSAMMVFSFSAIERSFHYGQASALVALFLYFAVFLHCLGRTYTATFFAAFGAVLKIYPIIYFFALILKGHYKESGLMILFMLGITLASIFVFGAADWAQFVSFQAGNPLVDRGGAEHEAARALLYEVPNYSPTAMLFLLSDQMGWGWSQTEIWRVVRMAVLFVALAVYAALWRRIYDSFGFVQVVGLGLVGIMLISPLLWNHVFIMLLPVYTVLLYRAIFDRERSFSSFLWLIVSFGLVAFPDLLTNLTFTNNGFLVLLKYTKLYGVFILSFFLCFSVYCCDWHEERAERSP